MPQAALSRWQPLFVGLWLTGVSLLAARLLMGYLATLWLRGDRRPLPAELALKVACRPATARHENQRDFSYLP